tara:strand:+ start:369 stop:536 length:168 start_codon:yes stop_codon:yes gene_type:complete
LDLVTEPEADCLIFPWLDKGLVRVRLPVSKVAIDIANKKPAESSGRFLQMPNAAS